jgi:hypothetical protein
MSARMLKLVTTGNFSAADNDIDSSKLNNTSRTRIGKHLIGM